MIAAWTIVALAASSAPAWEEITSEDGITVWQREVAGTSLVEFRAIAVIDADIRKVAAVIRNDEHKTRWMKNCVVNEAKQMFSAVHELVYNRTASPVFFVSDRDVVVEVKASIVPGAVVIEFRDRKHPSVPELEGVVRVARLIGSWRLSRSGAKTEVIYQVQADPGGSLPKWLVNWAASTLPFDTLAALRVEAAKTGYEHDQMILERALDWSRLEGTKLSTRAADGRSLAR